jgi:hypothetical protein
MKRKAFVISAMAAAIVFGLGGCAHHMAHEGGMMGQPMNVQVYTATLTPGEETPPATDSQGSGTAEVTINTSTDELTYKVTWSGLTGPATMGHIHGPAERGKEAKPVVPFTGVAGQSSAEGKAKITPTQYGDLAAGLYYVNIHTAKHPGGEIRGQLELKK